MDEIKQNFWQRLTRGEKILTVVLAVVFLVLFYFALDANKYSATVHAIAGEGKVGINPTTEVLDFGDLSPGTSAVRRIDVKNSTGIAMYIAVLHFGAINDLMKLDKNFFTVPAHTEEKIEFTVYMPASAPIDKTLNGKIILFKIPKLWK